MSASTVVSTAKFDRIMSKHIQLNPCRHCGADGEIHITLPVFGKTGALIRCCKCGAATKMFRITRSIVEDVAERRRIGTPVTSKSLQRGIFNAVNMWNTQNPKERENECVNVSINGVLNGD